MNNANAQTNNSTLRGTPAELAGHISLNGRRLEQPDISFLTRMGAAKKVGTSKKGGYHGGKPATIWEFGNKLTMKFEAVEPPAPPAPTPAPEPEKPKAEAKPERDTSNDAPKRDDANNVDDAPVTHKDLHEIIMRAVAEAVSQLGPKAQAPPAKHETEEQS
jgi:hypothetical protein